MGGFIETQVTKVEELIKQNEQLDHYLTKIEEKIKVKKAYILLGIATVLILWLASGHAGQLVCNAIGFLYPAYASIKAIGNRICKKQD
jgi:receptor expression-enhancing protein 5/6